VAKYPLTATALRRCVIFCRRAAFAISPVSLHGGGVIDVACHLLAACNISENQGVASSVRANGAGWRERRSVGWRDGVQRSA